MKVYVPCLQALKDRSSYLIVIMCIDVLIPNLDETMRLYVRTKTYLKRDDQWFWERLRRALPQNPMFTLPGGERGEDWCGIHGLARAQHEEQQRWEEVEIDLGHHRCQYHKGPEVNNIDGEGACGGGDIGEVWPICRHNRRVNALTSL